MTILIFADEDVITINFHIYLINVYFSLLLTKRVTLLKSQAESYETYFVHLELLAMLYQLGYYNDRLVVQHAIWLLYLRPLIPPCMCSPWLTHKFKRMGRVFVVSIVVSSEDMSQLAQLT